MKTNATTQLGAVLAGLLLTTLAAPGSAAIRLPAVISSHMVLQRGIAASIWGTAAPGEGVTVRFRDQHKNVLADSQGRWIVKLDPLQPGVPATLLITGSNTITLNDVLVGEVWVGSGQSNMSLRVSDLGKTVDADPVLTQAAHGVYPQLRLFVCKYGPGWEEANPQNIEGFSAELFSYGLSLQRELKVPIGLMVGAVGGTTCARWLSYDAYQADAGCKAAIAKFAATYSFEEAKQKYEAERAQWEKSPAATQAAAEKGNSSTTSRRPLHSGPIPPVHPGELEIPAVYGYRVGDLYELIIRPVMPYAIRGMLWDQGEGGTGLLGVEQYPLMGTLIHNWRQDWGQGDFPFIYFQKPSGDGCAWDPHDPITRHASSFVKLPTLPLNPAWGPHRETYIHIMRYPNTAMVQTSDLEPGVHPANKTGYAARAARVAMGMVYGSTTTYYGPIYRSHKIEGSAIRVSFSDVGKGLAFAHADKLYGFLIAADDKKFVWADATIEGGTVVVSSPKIPHPTAVRYAWGNPIAWANLFNKDGLPAPTFRTDDWAQ